MSTSTTWPRPIDILDFYRRSIEALQALRRSLDDGPPDDSHFFGLTLEERETSLEQMKNELDREVVMLLTASFEAIFRVDFHRRVAGRMRDDVSREFRKLHHSATQRRQHRPIRVQWEQILDVWQAKRGHVKKIGELKQLIQYRHWLAHGRYWVQKSGLRDPDPFDAWHRGKAVFDSLPDFGHTILPDADE